MINHTLDYRRGGKRDIARLAVLNRQLIEDEGRHKPPSNRMLARRLRKWMNRGYEAALFEIQGEIAAYALYLVESRLIHLRQFFVVRDRRRQGFGRQAFSYLLRDVWPEKSRILVEALVDNPPAVAFWKTMGFKDYAVMLEMRREPHNWE